MTPRVSKNPDKIKDVELVKNRWVYRPMIAKKDRGRIATDKRGRLAPPWRLCHKDAPKHERLIAYAKAVKRLAHVVDPTLHTLGWFEERYRQSDEFLALAADSQRKALSLNRILQYQVTVSDSEEMTLALVKPHELTKRTVRAIRQNRLKGYQAAGKDGRVQCNREIAYMRRMLNWADLYYDEVGDNPFAGIDALKEPKNDRYITDEEYWIQHKIAGEVADYLPVVMDLMYCYAARGIEVTDITIEAVLGTTSRRGDQVSRIRRRKGSKTTDIRNTPQVEHAIEAAMALHKQRKVVGKYLLPGMNGPQMRKSTIDTAMRRLSALMRKRGITSRHTFIEYQDDQESDLYFTLHRIKAKAITDSADKALAGQSKRMQEHYDKGVDTFDPPEMTVVDIKRND